MKKQALEILKSSNLFESLTVDAFDSLASAARTISGKPQSLLFSRGDDPDAVYLLGDGEIAIETISEQGKPVRVSTLRSGAIIGELGVLGNLPRTADARITRDAQLLKIDGATFVNTINSNPTVAMDLIKVLISRLAATNNQIENISLLPLRSRIAMTLLNKAMHLDEENCILNLTQSALADEVSASREKVNAHLQSIQDAGAIFLGRGKITIQSLDKLESIADTE